MSRTFLSLQFWYALKLDSSASFEGIAAKLSQLLSPCVFGHAHMLRTRDEEGYLALQCEDCGQVRRVLTKAPVKGPKLHADAVKGAPQTRVSVKQERRYPRSA